MSAKDARPGQYKPKCAKCGERFGLTVFADARPPKVEVLETAAVQPVGSATQPARQAATTLSPGVGTTLGKPSPVPGEPLIPAPLPTGSDATTVPESLSAAALPNPPDMPAQIGGYRILRELGRGAMGAVYLARQLSLDREVALKTIQGRWADNPTFVARFTREAYAAAQLVHHNVVQIYDLGTAGDTHYFSMELVRGESLDRVVRRDEKLDAELAVGYVLQAARGLKFAHDRGMVHRDVKPANLMLSEQGVLKVADLGLVKTPQLAAAEEAAEQAAEKSAAGQPPAASVAQVAAGAEMTQDNMAMGTPAYMAPEQAENAAGVDHRADIYSLGCTLYVLLTGRPPFEGATALEVITKHKTEPVVRPEAFVKRMPKGLSEITLKMVAKRPEDRYSNLGEVIRSLEDFLGIAPAGPYSPKEEHARTLDDCLAAFNGNSLVRMRRLVVLGWLGMCGLLLLLGLVLSWQLAAGVAALLGAAAGSYFLVGGNLERTYTLAKFREWLAISGPSDWLTWLGAIAVAGTVALILGWIGTLLIMTLLGLIAGIAYYVMIDRDLVRQRNEPLARMQQLLKSLRLKGVDEAALHQFVAKYSGQHWEEFFEALFGYEAKIAARKQWGKSDAGRERPRFRPWRDWFVRWIDGRIAAWREVRDRRHFQALEEKSLQAQGMDLITARRRAHLVTEAILDVAAETRASAVDATPATPADPALAAAKKRMKIKSMLADAKRGAYEAKRNRLARTALSPLAIVLGPKVRFALGCLLITGCALWARQNGLATQENLESVRSAVETSVQEQSASSLAGAAKALGQQQTSPLAIPVVGPYLSSFNAAVAGIVLVLLGMFRGWKMSLFALPAAAVMVAGSALGIPALVPLANVHVTSLAIGLVIAVVGVLLGQTADD
jgi:serine/threonine protein kinase